MSITIISSTSVFFVGPLCVVFSIEATDAHPHRRWSPRLAQSAQPPDVQPCLEHFGDLTHRRPVVRTFKPRPHYWLWPAWEARHDDLQARSSCYGSISGKSYLGSSRWRKASMSSRSDATILGNYPLLSNWLVRFEGTIHYSFRHIM